MTSQKDLIFEYYKDRPNESIPHAEVVDWAIDEYKKRTGKNFRDPDRAIRKLHQEGYLIKKGKGLYEYELKSVKEKALEDFTDKQKQEILKRDEYKCVMCGSGEKNGVELHIDHIKPKDKGGKATIDNGQTLCAKCNFKKKTYSRTESGKRMFILLLKQAQKVGDQETVTFAKAILETYKEYGVNGHIEWNEE